MSTVAIHDFARHGMHGDDWRAQLHGDDWRAQLHGDDGRATAFATHMFHAVFVSGDRQLLSDVVRKTTFGPRGHMAILGLVNHCRACGDPGVAIRSLYTVVAAMANAAGIRLGEAGLCIRRYDDDTAAADAADYHAYAADIAAYARALDATSVGILVGATSELIARQATRRRAPQGSQGSQGPQQEERGCIWTHSICMHLRELALKLREDQRTQATALMARIATVSASAEMGYVGK
jgi:hypothetical protein